MKVPVYATIQSDPPLSQTENRGWVDYALARETKQRDASGAMLVMFGTVDLAGAAWTYAAMRSGAGVKAPSVGEPRA